MYRLLTPLALLLPLHIPVIDAVPTESTLPTPSKGAIHAEQLQGASVKSKDKVKAEERVVEDSVLPSGVEVVVQEGKDGEITYFEKVEKILDSSGKTVESKTTFSVITKNPQERVVRRGTNSEVINGIDKKIVEEKEARLKELERQEQAAQASAARADKTSYTGLEQLSAGAAGFTSPEENRNYARSVLSASEFEDFNWIIMRESGWRTNATNPSSGAYGVAQSLPAGKYASQGADWRTNGRTQVDWAINYMRGRYGSIAQAKAFWLSHGWY